MRKKKVGILFDNISRNTGDVAIGLSVRVLLRKLGISTNHYTELIPGYSDLQRYEKLIIGGGLLVRTRGDFFYDKFRAQGSTYLELYGDRWSPK